MKNSLPLALVITKDLVKFSFLKDALKNMFSLIHAEDSLEGLDWLKGTTVEILILDPPALLHPLENICSKVQKITKTKYLPILLISNSLKKSAVLGALNAGVSDFLHEPLDALEIHERVSVYLHSKLISKKMKLVRSKIKESPLIPRNSKKFFEKTFIRDKTLQTIAAAKKGTVPLSVLMIHLDSFSHLQETLDENAKQEILTFLESFLKKRLRKYDTMTLEGPGQYLLLLPKTSQSAARAIAEDIRKEISTTTIVTSVKEVIVTVSIGVVSFEKELSKSAKDFEQFDLCLERVKKSLVRSQKKGNRIVEKT